MKDPDKVNVHDVFDGSVRYSAPVYQRYYVWGEEALQVLLEDIEASADQGSEQFIGAMVVQDFGKKGGNTSPNEYLIIDGQQRLTTIYLLICGLVWAYLEGKRTEEAKTLAQTYLAFSAGAYAGMPKLLPTLQDRKQFFEILKDEITCIEWNFKSSSVDEKSTRQGISAQWKRIKEHLDEELFNSKGKLQFLKAEEFQQKLLNEVVFIQVTLETKDDANTVFSKLNYDGVKLDLSDLVRNDVIARVDDKSKNAFDKFYDSCWAPFEGAFPRDSFDQYITIFAFVKFKGAVTKSRAFPELQKSWLSKKPAAIVADMLQYADLYCSLVQYAPIADFDSSVGERIQRLSLMPKTTVTWPYVLELLYAYRHAKATKKQVLECMSIVESFLVRRAVVGLEPTGLHAVFKALWGKAGANAKQLREKIVTGTIRCPDDRQVREALLSDDMYSRKITKYLLIQREIAFNATRGYDNAISDFSVEHVLPQNRNGEWAKGFTSREHKDLLHTIGNLVPLTKRQNGKIKDLPWAKKRAQLKGSNWKFTQRVAQARSWDVDKIRSRSREFAGWVLAEWSGFSRN